MANESETEEYDPNTLRQSELGDAIVLQNYPDIWRPLIKRMKVEKRLHPDFSFLNDTRTVLWLTGKDPNTGELVNELLVNEQCDEYFETFELKVHIRPNGARVDVELAPIKWKKKVSVGYVLSINFLGTWLGAFDMTRNLPESKRNEP